MALAKEILAQDPASVSGSGTEGHHELEVAGDAKTEEKQPESPRDVGRPTDY
jgi:hypothetical protein